MGIYLLIFFALLSSLESLIDAYKVHGVIGADYITKYEKRFDGIREFLPARGIVGYAGERINNAEYWKSDAAGLQNWFLTQYTLAPLIVSITPNHKLTIINNTEGGDPILSENAEVNARDLGNGARMLDFGNGIKLVVTQ
jgi:hypothetical protein